MRHFSVSLGLVMSLACLAFAGSAAADSFPSQPIHIIVPYEAGGSTDQLARIIQQPVSEALGQPVIIENKPGAGGTIGVELVVKAKPDGYTLVFGNTGPNAIVDFMRKVPYDPVKDLEPISDVAVAPMILTVRSDLPVNSVKEFIGYAKQHGNSMNFGSVGNGSLSHLSGEYLNSMAGTHILHIPYKGGAPVMTAFMSGDLQAAFVTGLDGATLLQTGKVKYIGVGSRQPTEVVPGVPPIAKDIPGFKSAAWFGVLGPKGMPKDVVDRLNKAIVSAVSKPEVRQKLLDRKVEPDPGTPEQLADLIREDRAQWGPVVKQADIHM
ncbi:Bug family tripartite tricarboxylate transporter substrate binding protein [Noviherbaspirillum pedocola]|uniref:Tripartite tricarboxylate transporter substrate binding protein n=1 Tax=Noviherbaspirillum pedocola TaxID=2801341 RepID=A0A934SYR9_9BURK|nr:tripartite tricarboxylate transporter substrate binding protein [Noviherbaspirillum pedocola]MBK4739020.1 tripartite tricarboxylate transporter substrate binding protein [Noviherbaspirillum pedocola]